MRVPGFNLVSLIVHLWFDFAISQLTYFPGNLAELQNDTDGALQAYERALSHNQYSVPALLAMSSILRSKDRFDMAVEYLRTILKVETNNGDVWGSLGKCTISSLLFLFRPFSADIKLVRPLSAIGLVAALLATFCLGCWKISALSCRPYFCQIEETAHSLLTPFCIELALDLAFLCLCTYERFKD